MYLVSNPNHLQVRSKNKSDESQVGREWRSENIVKHAGWLSNSWCDR